MSDELLTAGDIFIKISRKFCNKVCVYRRRFVCIYPEVYRFL